MEVCYVKSRGEIIVISLIILRLVNCAPVARNVRIQPCDPGYYSDAYSSRCRQCMVDCSRQFNRTLQLQCGYNHEAVCGSCLPGFRDEYSDVTMPCKELPRVKRLIILPDRNKSHPTYKKSSIHTAMQKHVRGQETQEINPQLYIRVVGISALGSSVSILVCVIFKKQEMPLRFGSPETIVEIEHGQALLPQSDLETDGPAHGEGTVTSRHQETPPRSELEGFQSSGPGAVLTALGSSVAILVFVIFRRRHYKRKKQEMSLRFRSPESVVEVEHGQALLPQSDLETDGPARGEATVTSRYQETPPRGELEGFQSSGPGAISPLSGAHSISHTPLTTSPRITYIVCHHFIPSTCSLCKTHSKSYQDSAGVILRRGDRYLAHVAMKICHDPTVFYNELDIPKCMLYQNAADHKAKENCPFAEHVLNNLNGWVGVKGQPCLESLLDALCKSGFHHISLDLLNMCDVRATDQL